MGTYYIYKRTNIITGMAYIGFTTLSLYKRANGLKGSSYAKTAYLGQAISDYGFENFKSEILLTVNNREMAKIAEKALIIGYNTLWPNGYNSSLGNIPSEETRKKNSENHKGKIPWNKGLPCSEEQKLKQSQAMKGRSVSEETKKKISESEKGRVLSEKTKKKISESRKGQPSWTKATHWFNNGLINVRAEECPEGFVKGILSSIRKST